MPGDFHSTVPDHRVHPLADYRRRRMDVWLAELAEAEAKDNADSPVDAAYLRGLRIKLVQAATGGLASLARVDVIVRAMEDFHG